MFLHVTVADLCSRWTVWRARRQGWGCVCTVFSFAGTKHSPSWRRPGAPRALQPGECPALLRGFRPLAGLLGSASVRVLLSAGLYLQTESRHGRSSGPLCLAHDAAAARCVPFLACRWVSHGRRTATLVKTQRSVNQTQKCFHALAAKARPRLHASLELAAHCCSSSEAKSSATKSCSSSPRSSSSSSSSASSSSSSSASPSSLSSSDSLPSSRRRFLLASLQRGRSQRHAST